MGLIQKDFFQEVTTYVFYSLEELNLRFPIYLEKLNNQIMKDYGASREDRFQQEKLLLKQLPPTLFEISEWQEAMIHPDSHIQVQKYFCSIPFNPHSAVLARKSLRLFSCDFDMLFDRCLWITL